MVSVLPGAEVTISPGSVGLKGADYQSVRMLTMGLVAGREKFWFPFPFPLSANKPAAGACAPLQIQQNGLEGFEGAGEGEAFAGAVDFGGISDRFWSFAQKCSYNSWLSLSFPVDAQASQAHQRC